MTPKQRAILEHVVKDADAWYSHAVQHFGQQLADQFLREKCARWEQEYDRESKRSDYKNRAQREADEQATR